jgi:hypothetical protein
LGSPGGGMEGAEAGMRERWDATMEAVWPQAPNAIAPTTTSGTTRTMTRLARMPDQTSGATRRFRGGAPGRSEGGDGGAVSGSLVKGRTPSIALCSPAYPG